MNMPQLLTYLRANRQNHHHTMIDVGTILEINKNTYNDYELGKRQMPIGLLIDLVHYYGHEIEIYDPKTQKIVNK